MNSRYVKPLILSLLIQVLFFSGLSAQIKPNTSISGKVFDKSTNQPLEYATIAVVSTQSGKIITGTVADAKGAFGISDVPYGSYRIKIEFLGYEKITVDSISINNEKHSLSLGTLFLSPATQNLQDVTVTADRPVVENRLDKIVYNVSNDITSQGGAAIDVLKKVPQVTVDLDGNVELQGNSNIRFLIDGKPSSVFGNSLSDALASIPASQIKSIEAITNPGAKYDSQGTGGIINIILKNNMIQGVNGNINLSGGTRLQNGSVNLNAKHNNFGVNTYFSGNGLLKSQLPYSQNRISTDTTAKTITSLLQNSTTSFVRNGFRSGIGFDWDISKKDNLTGSFGFNQFKNRNRGLTYQEQAVQDFSSVPKSVINTIRNSDNNFRIRSFDWSLAYKKKFNREGQELDILYNASNGNPYSYYLQSQSYEGQSVPYTGSTSTNPGTDKGTEISIDYTHPVNKNTIIETGAKTIFQNLESNADVSVFDPSLNQFISDALQSYHLNYTMKIYAGYLSTSFRLFNYLNIKAGARYEYTDAEIDFPNTSISPYGTFVPSGVLSHDFKKGQSLKFSFARRIERPEYRELNPFINLSDPYNITTGNPLLKPEIGNNLELGFSSTFKKGGNVYIALIERINTHDIKQITTFYPYYIIGDSIYTNVSVASNQNIGEEYNSGVIASGSVPLTSKLNIRGNLMATHRYLVTSVGTGNQSTGIRVRLNLNATYQLPKDLVLEFFGFYNSAARNIQGTIPQFFIYNFALRKLFWDKKASFGFTATNLFSKYVRQGTTISTENYISNSVRLLPLRSFGISLTYKFGKMEFRKNSEQDNNNFPETMSPGAG